MANGIKGAVSRDLVISMPAIHLMPFCLAGAGHFAKEAAALQPLAPQGLARQHPTCGLGAAEDLASSFSREDSGFQSALLHAKFFEKCDVIEEYLELYNLAT